MNNKILIGLPAYNEQLSLPKLFDKLLPLTNIYQNRLDIIIINDGSTDKTENILAQYNSMYPCIIYINHAVNKGLGQAMNTLLTYAIGNLNDDDVLVTLDADNTHNPNIIPEMVSRLKKENLDLMIASRFVKGGHELGLSLLRKMYSRGARIFFKLFFPIKNVTDYSCGFRVYNIGYLKRAMSIYNNKIITTNGFDCMAEILAKFSKIGIIAAEYPLILEYNLKEGKSKMRIGKTIMGYFNLLKRVKLPEGNFGNHIGG